MPYNETFEKLKAAQSPEFAEEIVAVRDNQTFFIGGYENTPEGNVPKGDFNEIFQALLNNDKALKVLADAIQARTITAGNGLQGGGSLATNRTIDVVSADDSITVGADNIKVNTYDGVDGSSTTRPGSAAAVKKAYDAGKNSVQKTQQVIAGNGLQGGGALSGDVTINVVSADDGITVNADNIKLNIYNDVNGTSATRPASANAVKKAYDKCPYNVGDIFLTTNATNPSTVWLGTTWQKIENAMLRATSSGQASKQVGGSDTVALSVAHMPAHTHSASQPAHSHSQPTHTHSQRINGQDGGVHGNYVSGTAYSNPVVDTGLRTSSGGGETTGAAQPSISIGSTGSGAAFSVVNRYYSVHVWLRLS